jgi:hypothetical protein
VDSVKQRAAPALAIAILLMGGIGCLLTAASDNVVAQLRFYLGVAGPLQIVLVAALLAHRDWAVPLTVVTFACQVTAIVTLTLTLLVTVGLGGDLLGYRGSGAVQPLIVAWAAVTMLAVAAVYGLAVRSINRAVQIPHATVGSDA